MRKILAFLRFIVFTAVMFAIGATAFVYPSWLLLFGMFTSLAGFVCVLLCFVPAGGVRLGDTAEISLGRWLVKLVVAQLILFGVSIAAFIVFFGAGPYFTVEDPISFSLATHIVGDYMRWQWGIFPWGVFALWGLVLAYTTYVKNGAPYLYQSGKDIWPKRIEAWFKSLIDAITRSATITLFSMIAVVIILLLSYSAQLFIGIHHFAAPWVAFTLFSFLGPLILWRFSTKKLRQKGAKNFSYNKLYTSLILILVFVIIATSMINRFYLEAHPEFANIRCDECVAVYNRVPIEVRFAAFFWGWWLLWTPIAGSYLAKISKGRTIREFVLGCFMIPALLLLVILNWGMAPFEGIVTWLISVPRLRLLLFLALFTWTALTLILNQKKKQNTELLVSGFMPVPENLKRNPLWLNDGPKVQGITHYASRLAMNMVAVVLLHTMMGWFGIQVMLVATGFMVIDAIYNGIANLIVLFFKDKTWLGNQNIPPYSK